MNLVTDVPLYDLSTLAFSENEGKRPSVDAMNVYVDNLP